MFLKNFFALRQLEQAQFDWLDKQQMKNSESSHKGSPTYNGCGISAAPAPSAVTKQN
jgi:hypothetical protein